MDEVKVLFSKLCNLRNDFQSQFLFSNWFSDYKATIVSSIFHLNKVHCISFHSV